MQHSNFTNVVFRYLMQSKQEPSPLGDLIYFFATDAPARKLADFRFMESRFPTFALPLSRGSGYATRLDLQWEHDYGSKSKKTQQKESGVGKEAERAVRVEANENEEEDEEDGDDDWEEKEGVTVVKSDTSK